MGSGGGPLSGGCGGKGGTASPAERHPPARRSPAPSLCPVKSGTADLRRRGRGVQLLAARVRPSPYPQPGSRGRPASGRRRPLPTWTGLRRTPSAEHALSPLSPWRPRTAGPPRSPQPLSFSVGRTALLGAGGHRDSSVTEQPPVGGGVPGLSPRLPHVPGRKGTSPRRHSQEKPDVFSGEGTCSLLKPVTCVSCQTEAKALGVRGGDFGTQQGGGLGAPLSAGLRGPAAALSSLDDSVPSSRQERGEGTESTAPSTGSAWRLCARHRSRQSGILRGGRRRHPEPRPAGNQTLPRDGAGASSPGSARHVHARPPRPLCPVPATYAPRTNGEGATENRTGASNRGSARLGPQNAVPEYPGGFMHTNSGMSIPALSTQLNASKPPGTD